MPGSVVKARFSGASTGGMRGSLEYFAHRPDLEQARADREVVTAYGRYHLDQGGDQAWEALNQELRPGDHRYLYSVILSPGEPDFSVHQTETWARQLLEDNNFNRYALVVHAGAGRHTEQPHAHVLITVDQRLTVPQLQQLRHRGDVEKARMLEPSPLQRHTTVEQGVQATLKAHGHAAEQAAGGGAESTQSRRHVDLQLGR
ncbi:hypothetical protein [Deinococcus sp.]|uniref:hypothetical protein n=1 Tax=Deinococcus sp. TaxID=47478 RepID=UPI0025E74A5D|nr:hypothetical protein [Deinococcus sp.]